MDKESRVLGVAALILLLILVVPLLKPLLVNKNPAVTAGGEDIFEGIITNMQDLQLSPGKLQGVGVYDKSCNMAGGGLTQCDAGIQTEKGLLNFNYKHNMQLQPCISPGDNLEVEILSSDGKASVKRIN